MILEGSASSSGAQLAWDGDLTTSWVPNMTEDGIYNVTVYLGELYLVQVRCGHTLCVKKHPVGIVVKDIAISARGLGFDSRAG